MDNFFGSPGSSSKGPLVVVPAKGKRKTQAKPVASSRTFVVRVPEKRPIAKATGKAGKTKIVPDKDLEMEEDNDSDFAPGGVSSEGGATEAEFAISEDEAELKEEDEEYDLEPEPAAAKKASSKGKGKEPTDGSVPKHYSKSIPSGLTIKPREGDLPPISDLQLIFDDIISRAPAVVDLFGTKGIRKLRVATMCSGTESPLLALGLMGRSLQAQKLGKLELDHIFSCEIEPYKQA